MSQLKVLTAAREHLDQGDSTASAFIQGLSGALWENLVPQELESEQKERLTDRTLKAQAPLQFDLDEDWFPKCKIIQYPKTSQKGFSNTLNGHALNLTHCCFLTFHFHPCIFNWRLFFIILYNHYFIYINFIQTICLLFLLAFQTWGLRSFHFFWKYMLQTFFGEHA